MNKNLFVNEGGAKLSQGLSLQLQSLISPLKEVFITQLKEEETEELAGQKVPLHLIEIISKLVQKIIFNELKIEEVCKNFFLFKTF